MEKLKKVQEIQEFKIEGEKATETDLEPKICRLQTRCGRRKN